MRITRTERRTVLRDAPGCFWLFGAFFVSVASIFVLGPLGLFTNLADVPLWARAFSVLVGSIGVGAGVWIVYTSPRTVTTFDGDRRRIDIRRRWLAPAAEYAFGDVAELLVAESPDDEGGRTFQPQLVLRSGEVVPLSRLWIGDERACETAVAAAGEALGDARRPRRS
jgi:hypothetical protein